MNNSSHSLKTRKGKGAEDASLLQTLSSSTGNPPPAATVGAATSGIFASKGLENTRRNTKGKGTASGGGGGGASSSSPSPTKHFSSAAINLDPWAAVPLVDEHGASIILSKEEALLQERMRQIGIAHQQQQQQQQNQARLGNASSLASFSPPLPPRPPSSSSMAKTASVNAANSPAGSANANNSNNTNIISAPLAAKAPIQSTSAFSTTPLDGKALANSLRPSSASYAASLSLSTTIMPAAAAQHQQQNATTQRNRPATAGASASSTASTAMAPTRRGDGGTGDSGGGDGFVLPSLSYFSSSSPNAMPNPALAAHHHLDLQQSDTHDSSGLSRRDASSSPPPPPPPPLSAATSNKGEVDVTAANTTNDASTKRTRPENEKRGNTDDADNLIDDDDEESASIRRFVAAIKEDEDAVRSLVTIDVRQVALLVLQQLGPQGVEQLEAIVRGHTSSAKEALRRHLAEDEDTQNSRVFGVVSGGNASKRSGGGASRSGDPKTVPSYMLPKRSVLANNRDGSDVSQQQNAKNKSILLRQTAEDLPAAGIDGDSFVVAVLRCLGHSTKLYGASSYPWIRKCAVGADGKRIYSDLDVGAGGAIFGREIPKVSEDFKKDTTKKKTTLSNTASGGTKSQADDLNSASLSNAAKDLIVITNAGAAAAKGGGEDRMDFLPDTVRVHGGVHFRGGDEYPFCLVGNGPTVVAREALMSRFIQYISSTRYGAGGMQEMLLVLHNGAVDTSDSAAAAEARSKFARKFLALASQQQQQQTVPLALPCFSPTAASTSKKRNFLLKYKSTVNPYVVVEKNSPASPSRDTSPTNKDKDLIISVPTDTSSTTAVGGGATGGSGVSSFPSSPHLRIPYRAVNNADGRTLLNGHAAATNATISSAAFYHTTRRTPNMLAPDRIPVNPLADPWLLPYALLLLFHEIDANASNSVSWEAMTSYLGLIGNRHNSNLVKTKQAEQQRKLLLAASGARRRGGGGSASMNEMDLSTQSFSSQLLAELSDAAVLAKHASAAAGLLTSSDLASGGGGGGGAADEDSPTQRKKKSLTISNYTSDKTLEGGGAGAGADAAAAGGSGASDVPPLVPSAPIQIVEWGPSSAGATHADRYIPFLVHACFSHNTDKIIAVTSNDDVLFLDDQSMVIRGMLPPLQNMTPTAMEAAAAGGGKSNGGSGSGGGGVNNGSGIGGLGGLSLSSMTKQSNANNGLGRGFGDSASTISSSGAATSIGAGANSIMHGRETSATAKALTDRKMGSHKLNRTHDEGLSTSSMQLLSGNSFVTALEHFVLPQRNGKLKSAFDDSSSPSSPAMGRTSKSDDDDEDDDDDADGGGGGGGGGNGYSALPSSFGGGGGSSRLKRRNKYGFSSNTEGIIAVAGADSYLRLYHYHHNNLRTAQMSFLQPFGSPQTCVKWVPELNCLLSGARSGCISKVASKSATAAVAQSAIERGRREMRQVDKSYIATQRRKVRATTERLFRGNDGGGGERKESERGGYSKLAGSSKPSADRDREDDDGHGGSMDNNDEAADYTSSSCVDDDGNTTAESETTHGKEQQSRRKRRRRWRRSDMPSLKDEYAYFDQHLNERFHSKMLAKQLERVRGARRAAAAAAAMAAARQGGGGGGKGDSTADDPSAATSYFSKSSFLAAEEDDSRSEFLTWTSAPLTFDVTSPVTDMVFMPTRTLLAVATNVGTLSFLDIDRFTSVSSFSNGGGGGKGGGGGGSSSADRTASASYYRPLSLGTAENPVGIYSLAHSADFEIVACGGSEPSPFFIFPGGTPIPLYNGGETHTSAICSVEFLRGTSIFLSADISGTVKLWDVRRMACVTTVDTCADIAADYQRSMGRLQASERRLKNQAHAEELAIKSGVIAGNHRSSSSSATPARPGSLLLSQQQSSSISSTSFMTPPRTPAPSSTSTVTTTPTVGRDGNSNHDAATTTTHPDNTNTTSTNTNSSSSASQSVMSKARERYLTAQGSPALRHLKRAKAEEAFKLALSQSALQQRSGEVSESLRYGAHGGGGDDIGGGGLGGSVALGSSSINQSINSSSATNVSGHGGSKATKRSSSSSNANTNGGSNATAAVVANPSAAQVIRKPFRNMVKLAINYYSGFIDIAGARSIQRLGHRWIIPHKIKGGGGGGGASQSSSAARKAQMLMGAGGGGGLGSPSASSSMLASSAGSLLGSLSALAYSAAEHMLRRANPSFFNNLNALKRELLVLRAVAENAGIVMENNNRGVPSLTTYFQDHYYAQLRTLRQKQQQQQKEKEGEKSTAFDVAASSSRRVSIAVMLLTEGGATSATRRPSAAAVVSALNPAALKAEGGATAVNTTPTTAALPLPSSPSNPNRDPINAKASTNANSSGVSSGGGPTIGRYDTATMGPIVSLKTVTVPRRMVRQAVRTTQQRRLAAIVEDHAALRQAAAAAAGSSSGSGGGGGASGKRESSAVPSFPSSSPPPSQPSSSKPLTTEAVEGMAGIAPLSQSMEALSRHIIIRLVGEEGQKHEMDAPQKIDGGVSDNHNSAPNSTGDAQQPTRKRSTIRFRAEEETLIVAMTSSALMVWNARSGEFVLKNGPLKVADLHRAHLQQLHNTHRHLITQREAAARRLLVQMSSGSGMGLVGVGGGVGGGQQKKVGGASPPLSSSSPSTPLRKNNNTVANLDETATFVDSTVNTPSTTAITLNSPSTRNVHFEKNSTAVSYHQSVGYAVGEGNSPPMYPPSPAATSPSSSPSSMFASPLTQQSTLNNTMTAAQQAPQQAVPIRYSITNLPPHIERTLWRTHGPPPTLPPYYEHPRDFNRDPYSRSSRGVAFGGGGGGGGNAFSLSHNNGNSNNGVQAFYDRRVEFLSMEVVYVGRRGDSYLQIEASDEDEDDEEDNAEDGVGGSSSPSPLSKGEDSSFYDSASSLVPHPNDDLILIVHAGTDCGRVIEVTLVIDASLPSAATQKQAQDALLAAAATSGNANLGQNRQHPQQFPPPMASFSPSSPAAFSPSPAFNSPFDNNNNNTNATSHQRRISAPFLSSPPPPPSSSSPSHQVGSREFEEEAKTLFVIPHIVVKCVGLSSQHTSLHIRRVQRQRAKERRRQKEMSMAASALIASTIGRHHHNNQDEEEGEGVSSASASRRKTALPQKGYTDANNNASSLNATTVNSTTTNTASSPSRQQQQQTAANTASKNSTKNSGGNNSTTHFGASGALCKDDHPWVPFPITTVVKPQDFFVDDELGLRRQVRAHERYMRKLKKSTIEDLAPLELERQLSALAASTAVGGSGGAYDSMYGHPHNAATPASSAAATAFLRHRGFSTSQAAFGASALFQSSFLSNTYNNNTNNNSMTTSNMNVSGSYNHNHHSSNGSRHDGSREGRAQRRAAAERESLKYQAIHRRAAYQSRMLLQYNVGAVTARTALSRTNLIRVDDVVKASVGGTYELDYDAKLKEALRRRAYRSRLRAEAALLRHVAQEEIDAKYREAVAAAEKEKAQRERSSLFSSTGMAPTHHRHSTNKHHTTTTTTPASATTSSSPPPPILLRLPQSFASDFMSSLGALRAALNEEVLSSSGSSGSESSDEDDDDEEVQTGGNQNNKTMSSGGLSSPPDEREAATQHQQHRASRSSSLPFSPTTPLASPPLANLAKEQQQRQQRLRQASVTAEATTRVAYINAEEERRVRSGVSRGNGSAMDGRSWPNRPMSKKKKCSRLSRAGGNNGSSDFGGGGDGGADASVISKGPSRYQHRPRNVFMYCGVFPLLVTEEAGGEAFYYRNLLLNDSSSGSDKGEPFSDEDGGDDGTNNNGSKSDNGADFDDDDTFTISGWSGRNRRSTVALAGGGFMTVPFGGGGSGGVNTSANRSRTASTTVFSAGGGVGGRVSMFSANGGGGGIFSNQFFSGGSSGGGGGNVVNVDSSYPIAPPPPNAVDYVSLAIDGVNNGGLSPKAMRSAAAMENTAFSSVAAIDCGAVPSASASSTPSPSAPLPSKNNAAAASSSDSKIASASTSASSALTADSPHPDSAFPARSALYRHHRRQVLYHEKAYAAVLRTGDGLDVRLHDFGRGGKEDEKEEEEKGGGGETPTTQKSRTETASTFRAFQDDSQTATNTPATINITTNGGGDRDVDDEISYSSEVYRLRRAPPNARCDFPKPPMTSIPFADRGAVGCTDIGRCASASTPPPSPQATPRYRVNPSSNSATDPSSSSSTAFLYVMFATTMNTQVFMVLKREPLLQRSHKRESRLSKKAPLEQQLQRRMSLFDGGYTSVASYFKDRRAVGAFNAECRAIVAALEEQQLRRQREKTPPAHHHIITTSSSNTTAKGSGGVDFDNIMKRRKKSAHFYYGDGTNPRHLGYQWVRVRIDVIRTMPDFADCIRAWYLEINNAHTIFAADSSGGVQWSAYPNVEEVSSAASTSSLSSATAGSGLGGGRETAYSSALGATTIKSSSEQKKHRKSSAAAAAFASAYASHAILMDGGDDDSVDDEDEDDDASAPPLRSTSASSSKALGFHANRSSSSATSSSSVTAPPYPLATAAGLLKSLNRQQAEEEKKKKQQSSSSSSAAAHHNHHHHFTPSSMHPVCIARFQAPQRPTDTAPSTCVGVSLLTRRTFAGPDAHAAAHREARDAAEGEYEVVDRLLVVVTRSGLVGLYDVAKHHDELFRGGDPCVAARRRRDGALLSAAASASASPTPAATKTGGNASSQGGSNTNTNHPRRSSSAPLRPSSCAVGQDAPPPPPRRRSRRVTLTPSSELLVQADVGHSGAASTSAARNGNSNGNGDRSRSGQLAVSSSMVMPANVNIFDADIPLAQKSLAVSAGALPLPLAPARLTDEERRRMAERLGYRYQQQQQQQQLRLKKSSDGSTAKNSINSSTLPSAPNPLPASMDLTLGVLSRFPVTLYGPSTATPFPPRLVQCFSVGMWAAEHQHHQSGSSGSGSGGGGPQRVVTSFVHLKSQRLLVFGVAELVQKMPPGGGEGVGGGVGVESENGAASSSLQSPTTTAAAGSDQNNTSSVVTAVMMMPAQYRTVGGKIVSGGGGSVASASERPQRIATLILTHTYWGVPVSAIDAGRYFTASYLSDVRRLLPAAAAFNSSANAFQAKQQQQRQQRHNPLSSPSTSSIVMSVTYVGAAAPPPTSKNTSSFGSSSSSAFASYVPPPRIHNHSTISFVTATIPREEAVAALLEGRRRAMRKALLMANRNTKEGADLSKHNDGDEDEDAMTDATHHNHRDSGGGGADDQLYAYFSKIKRADTVLGPHHKALRQGHLASIVGVVVEAVPDESDVPPPFGVDYRYDFHQYEIASAVVRCLEEVTGAASSSVGGVASRSPQLYAASPISSPSTPPAATTTSEQTLHRPPQLPEEVLRLKRRITAEGAAKRDERRRRSSTRLLAAQLKHASGGGGGDATPPANAVDASAISAIGPLPTNSRGSRRASAVAAADFTSSSSSSFSSSSDDLDIDSDTEDIIVDASQLPPAREANPPPTPPPPPLPSSSPETTSANHLLPPQSPHSPSATAQQHNNHHQREEAGEGEGEEKRRNSSIPVLTAATAPPSADVSGILKGHPSAAAGGGGDRGRRVSNSVTFAPQLLHQPVAKIATVTVTATTTTTPPRPTTSSAPITPTTASLAPPAITKARKEEDRETDDHHRMMNRSDTYITATADDDDVNVSKITVEGSADEASPIPHHNRSHHHHQHDKTSLSAAVVGLNRVSSIFTEGNRRQHRTQQRGGSSSGSGFATNDVNGRSLSNSTGLGGGDDNGGSVTPFLRGVKPDAAAASASAVIAMNTPMRPKQKQIDNNGDGEEERSTTPPLGNDHVGSGNDHVGSGNDHSGSGSGSSKKKHALGNHNHNHHHTGIMVDILSNEKVKIVLPDGSVSYHTGDEDAPPHGNAGRKRGGGGADGGMGVVHHHTATTTTTTTRVTRRMRARGKEAEEGHGDGEDEEAVVVEETTVTEVLVSDANDDEADGTAEAEKIANPETLDATEKKEEEEKPFVSCAEKDPTLPEEALLRNDADDDDEHPSTANQQPPRLLFFNNRQHTARAAKDGNQDDTVSPPLSIPIAFDEIDAEVEAEEVEIIGTASGMNANKHNRHKGNHHHHRAFNTHDVLLRQAMVESVSCSRIEKHNAMMIESHDAKQQNHSRANDNTTDHHNAEDTMGRQRPFRAHTSIAGRLRGQHKKETQRQHQTIVADDGGGGGFFLESAKATPMERTMMRSSPSPNRSRSRSPPHHPSSRPTAFVPPPLSQLDRTTGSGKFLNADRTQTYSK